MIDPNTAIENTAISGKTQGKHVFRMIENDRTAGSMPCWDKPETGIQTLEQGLGQSISGEKQEEFADILAYQSAKPLETAPQKSGTSDESFGFLDIVDMVNPLQHIPLLNLAYRGMTGDEIKPIGKIIGGALFGGPMGASGGIVDAIITNETGKDFAGNAFDLAHISTSQEMLPPDLKTANASQNAARAYEKMNFADDRTAGSIVRYA
jgi:hypothetical protein